MLFINYLKRSIVLIAILIMAINTSFAQSYYHSPNDTIISNAPFDDVSVFNITQVHPTSDTIFFHWQKQSAVMPATWEASICDVAHCYTELKDSGTTDPIVTGGDGLMSLHLNPNFEAGTAIIRYSIFTTNTPAQIDTLTWIITATAPNAIVTTRNILPTIYYDNKQIICRNIHENYSKVFLYDMNGKLLLQKNIETEEVTLFTYEYGPQLLILQLIGKQNFISKIFNY